MRNSAFNEIVEWIEAHLAINPSVADIASGVGCSRRTVYNVFYEYAGIPVGKYIRMRRMTYAAGRLKLTRQSISSIACQLHFDSPQTFSREFKKNFGRCPGEYRHSTYWDLSLLHQKVTSHDCRFPEPYLCLLEEQIFAGYGFNYTLSLSDDIASRKNITRRKITTSMFGDDRDIFILSDFFPAANNAYKTMINAFIGTPLNLRNDACREIRIAKRGWYLGLDFSGSWEEFTLLSNHVYMKYLPELGLYRRQGYDIERFVPLKRAGIENTRSIYTIQYFVPVAYI